MRFHIIDLAAESSFLSVSLLWGRGGLSGRGLRNGMVRSARAHDTTRTVYNFTIPYCIIRSWFNIVVCSGYVHCVAGSEPATLLSGGEDGAIKLWDTRSTHSLYHLQLAIF